MRTVVFSGHRFHDAMLGPIVAALSRRNVANVLYTDDLSTARAHRPELLVVADKLEYLFQDLPTLPFTLFTRHGFASKSNLGPAVRSCDIACISSEWVRDDLLAQKIRPRVDFAITGFPPMDQVFQAINTPVADTTRTERRILYAPSFTPGYSSAPLFDASWIKAILDSAANIQLVIKPHPMMAVVYPAQVALWQQLAATNPRVRLVNDHHSDVYALFSESDALISDVSSVAFYFLATQRPILFIKPPQPTLNPFQMDLAGIEWRWRDCGPEVNSAQALCHTLGQLLKNPPPEYAQRRQQYAQNMFGEHRQGDAAERIATLIQDLEQSFSPASPSSASATGRLYWESARYQAALRRINLQPWPWVCLPYRY